MNKIHYIYLAAAMLGAASCQEKDIDVTAPVVTPIQAEQLTGELQGNDYVWTWPAQSGLKMSVNVLQGTSGVAAETVEGNSYVHRNVATNIEYTYVFKLTDGRNMSKGVVKTYTRTGASPVSGITVTQVENPDASYSALVEWNASADATALDFTAEAGTRKVTQTLAGDATSYTIDGVLDGEEWNVTVTARNDSGNSLSATGSLRIGKTAIGFLSIYPTEAELIAGGDDDEACAWLWLKAEYPSAQYVYFGDITGAETIAPYRVLFWMRDLEGVEPDAVFRVPQVVEDATPAVTEWYKAGGNLLLWSHATAYIGQLGRIPTEMLATNDRNINTGFGGWNFDTWSMAVQLHPGSRFKKDASSHPIFKGLEVRETDRTKLIVFKGPGWTEDHNCLYFNLPSVITGIGNQEEACYEEITNKYGIYPLGTWDSQIDWVSQLNVWEARQGNTDYKGTVICIGNGGCEFSLRNADGSADISAYPKNNIYQGNVLKLAKNSLEYLKTR